MTTSTPKRLVTGIKTTGTPHLGNYIGAIKPSIVNSKQNKTASFFFLADYHALISERNPENIKKSTLAVAASWLASGLDTDKDIFYRQSDITEILELNWILSCVTAKGLMNRAHAYKASVQQNVMLNSKDEDKSITMGLFCYPILMAADILAVDASHVPVGHDQIQHIEMTRDIAARMNHLYKTNIYLPEAILQKDKVLLGLDGRKMSKSYNNTIPLFCSDKQLLKLIKKIKTNSLAPGEPKAIEGCNLFSLFSAFCPDEQLVDIKLEYKKGASWGNLKVYLFEIINSHLKELREKYNYFINSPEIIEEKLSQGAIQARSIIKAKLLDIRNKIGF